MTFTTIESQTAICTSVVTGCDSLATLNLTVNPTPDLFYVLGSSAICFGATTDIDLSSSFSGTIYYWNYAQTLDDVANTGNGNEINEAIVATTINCWSCESHSLKNKDMFIASPSVMHLKVAL